MEKYKKFRDESTGINPFTPVRGLDRISWGRWILGLVVLIGTAPLCLIIETLIILYESLYTCFSVAHLQAVVKIVLCPVQWLSTRLYIILLHHSFWSGNYSLHPQRASTRTNNSSATAAASSSSASSSSTTTFGGQEEDVDVLKASPTSSGIFDEPLPVPGTVIFVNCQSPLDVIVLQRLFWQTPLLFAFPASPEDQSEHADGVYWTAFRHAAMYRILSEKAIPDLRPSTCDLRAICRLATRIGRLVVFFGEATTTNGRAVIQSPVATKVEGGSEMVSAAGITYLNSAATNTTIPQNMFSFLIRLLGESALSGGNQIDVTMARPSVLSDLQRVQLDQQQAAIGCGTSTGGGIFFDSTMQQSTVSGDAMQKVVAATVSFERLSSSPCIPLDLSSADKVKFMEMWNKYETKEEEKEKESSKKK